jgi:YggT family protein
VSSILCLLLTVALIALAARAIMSWFPIRPGSPFASLNRVLIDVTEPVLAPMRRIIPPAGPLDMSFFVLTFLIVILRNVVC